MPHPFLLVAGVFICIGTGVLLVNEYQQFKAEEEEFNQIRFKPNRITLKTNHCKQETDDEDEGEEEIQKNLSPSCYQTFRIDPFKHHESTYNDQLPVTLRNRFQTNHNYNRDSKSKIFPLIDLSEQYEPPKLNESSPISNPFEKSRTSSTKDQSDIHLQENLRNGNQDDSISLTTSPAPSFHGQGGPFDNEQKYFPRQAESSHTEESFSEQENSSYHGQKTPSQIPEPEMPMTPIEFNDSTKMSEEETNSDQSSSKPPQSVSSKISFDELESNQSDESSNWLEIESHDSTDEFELM